MSTSADWTTGVTWSLRRHAVRPGADQVVRDQFMSACNGSTYVYINGRSPYVPSHITEAKKIPNCKRCEKILAREAGITFDQLAAKGAGA